MTTSTSRSKAEPRVLETRFVWGPTIDAAMGLASSMEWRGWKIQGNPAPMFYNGVYGTGVSVTRVSND